jgi:hypothetical protein
MGKHPRRAFAPAGTRLSDPARVLGIQRARESTDFRILSSDLAPGRPAKGLKLLAARVVAGPETGTTAESTTPHAVTSNYALHWATVIKAELRRAIERVTGDDPRDIEPPLSGANTKDGAPACQGAGDGNDRPPAGASSMTSRWSGTLSLMDAGLS